MSKAKRLPPKDPDDTDFRYIVWCSKDGTNDGSADDTGELQGDTISVSAWTVPSGITEVTSNTAAITIKGVEYPVDTVATIKLSGGTVDIDYELTNKITTGDSRILSRSITVQVREQ
jgi:hypothetical protein